MAGGEVVSGEITFFSIDVFNVQSDGDITCLTCKRIVETGGLIELGASELPYGLPVFRPLDHDPHCPARNHVYLEGIGPMIEPRAMVFEKDDGTP